jgi:hypothetical protein
MTETNVLTEHPIEIAPTLEDGRALELAPVYISLGLEPAAFPAELGGGTDAVARSAAAKSVFDCALRGSGQWADRIWFFRGDSYLRYYEKPAGDDRYDPWSRIDAGWPGWPPSLATGVDAAVQGTGAFEGKAYFFKEGSYLRYDLQADRVDSGPTPIAAGWRGVPAGFAGGIDAAIHGVGPHYGVCWLFKGAQYVRYNMVTDQAEGSEPRSLPGAWGSGAWPAAFADGIDYAFYGTGAEAEKIYFFRGDKYIRYDLPSDRVEEGPKPISARWPKLSRFIAKPQLFLVEDYTLHTFRGQVGRGAIIDTRSVDGNTSTEFYIVTQTNETIDQRTSSNILESSSSQAVHEFSEAVRTDQSNAGNEEKYDYGMDASFHGEAAWSPGGASVDADAHVRGGSHDVRTSFANAVGSEIADKEGETRETHRQQVSTQDKDYKIDVKKETGYRQVVNNSGNPVPLNFAVSQLTQEYVVILALSGPRVAFHNGDERQARTVSLRDLGPLLEQCLVDPIARASIAASIVDTLQHVVDANGEVRSLVTAVSGDPTRFTTVANLTSTYEAKDSEGKTLRPFVVPGIILKVDRPVVLTANTITNRVS